MDTTLRQLESAIESAMPVDRLAVAADLAEVRKEQQTAIGHEAAAEALVTKASADYQRNIQTLKRQQELVISASTDLLARRVHRDQCDVVVVTMLEKLKS